MKLMLWLSGSPQHEELYHMVTALGRLRSTGLEQSAVCSVLINQVAVLDLFSGLTVCSSQVSLEDHMTSE